MPPAELVRFGARELTPRFPDECAQKQAAAHPDAAMDAPDREVDAGRRQRLFPREDVLVNAVQQRPVEVEEHCGTVGVPSDGRTGMARLLTHDSKTLVEDGRVAGFEDPEEE